MKLAIVTDAWAPQVSGVVTTVANISAMIREMGHEVLMVTPEGFRTMPCPGYAEIRLALKPRRRVFRMLDEFRPDSVHIATEGPLGHSARRWCLRRDFPFASSYHTQFPEYIRLRAPIPVGATYAYLRRFHGPAHTTLVRTRTQKELMKSHGFSHLKVWPGAVDTELFRPRGKEALSLPRPLAMYMGRVAVEKNIGAFLDLDLPGSKVVVGGGPDLDKLRGKYPSAHFTGPRFGEELARLLSAADVFVFPSRTDTFGLVMLEAMACGIPVAAFPVPGPLDVIREGSTGAMDENLSAAVYRALSLDGEACIEFAQYHSWQQSALRFLKFQRGAVCADPRSDPARENVNPASLTGPRSG
jgi:glycosyltransferase involved in cell wall biosynthesis